LRFVTLLGIRQGEKIGRARQAADMGREDSVHAPVHDFGRS
jgi:hypothetical protein